MLVLLVVPVVVLLGYRAFKQNKIHSAARIKTPNGIESLELVSVNRSQQWIYLRGHDQDNPVLLFLHGGPGAPLLSVARLFGLELEKHFTVVHWDQRASGKSRRQSYDDNELTLRTYLDDTLFVVNLLRERFGQDKIYLVGHSWGSILGVHTVRDHPELFHAYIGMGQTVNMGEGERISMEFVKDRAREEGNAKALAELTTLSPPYLEDASQLIVQRKWLGHFKAMHEFSIAQLMNPLFTSPEYSILDIVAWIRGVILLAQRTWPEVVSIDFFIEAPKLDLPVYFFTGRYDHQTPFELTERYLEMLEAPYKALIWFEKSAHMMNLSEPDYYQDVLINKVLKETWPTKTDVTN